MSLTRSATSGAPAPVDVADIFSPLDPDLFSSTYFNKSSVHIAGFPEKFAGILRWEDLGGLLDVARFPDEDIRLVRNLEYRRCDSLRELQCGLKEGFTLVFNDLHRRSKAVGVLAERIGAFFQEPTQVNLYLSHPSHNGFGLHYDNHDVLVFQLSGAKRWEIFAPTIEKPVVLMKQHDTRTPPGSPYLVAKLNAGDLLYVPRGHWHFAKPEAGEPSLHLTLGILSRTGLDFLDWLKGELSESSLWRDSFTVGRQAHAKALVDSLLDTLSSKVLFDRFYEYCCMNLWKTNQIDLPYCYSEAAGLRIEDGKVAVSPYLPVIKKIEQGAVVLLFNNTRVVLKHLAEPLVDVLLTRQPLDLTQLHQYRFDVEEDQVFAVVRALFGAGLLHVYREP